MKYANGTVYKALFLSAFFGFLRLASLVPSSKLAFDKTRFPMRKDIVWGPPGAHLIITCAKSKQNSNQVQVVQLPKLNSILCPVKAFQDMMKKFPSAPDLPLFQISSHSQIVPLTAHKARSFLKLVVINLGLNPSSYTFHSFRRSGASLAFDYDIQFEKIQQHGGWSSDAIWTYLHNTPKSASTIPTTFQKLIDNL